MTKNIKRIISISLSAVLAITMLFATTSVSFAKAPKLEKTEYEGSGKVEVEFIQKVTYKKGFKIKVLDSNNKTYSVKILKKENDDIEFKILKYKTGLKYKYTITGIKVRGTSKYGKVSGTFKIPKPASTTITKEKAKTIALKDAGLTESKVYDLEVEKDKENGKIVFEVSFETKKYEYEYEISAAGKILFKEKELND